MTLKYNINKEQKARYRKFMINNRTVAHVARIAALDILLKALKTDNKENAVNMIQEYSDKEINNVILINSVFLLQHGIPQEFCFGKEKQDGLIVLEGDEHNFYTSLIFVWYFAKELENDNAFWDIIESNYEINDIKNNLYNIDIKKDYDAEDNDEDNVENNVEEKNKYAEELISFLKDIEKDSKQIYQVPDIKEKLVNDDEYIKKVKEFNDKRIKFIQMLPPKVDFTDEFNNEFNTNEFKDAFKKLMQIFDK